MEQFLPFFLIISAGVFFSMLARRIHAPWVVALILAGILVGPHAFDLLEITPTIDFLGQLGLIFLMFVAGLETKISSFKVFRKKLLWLAFLNGSVPFLVGLGLGFLFGYGWTSSLLIGIIFISSSIAVVIPSLERHGLLQTRLGHSVVMTSVIQDVASLLLLSALLQTINPVTHLPLWLFYPLLIAAVVGLRYLLPKIIEFFEWSLGSGKDMFQQEFRFVFLVLLGTVIVFEFLGLHPIIAAFFAGLVLSETITSAVLKNKIRTISYGIFIPVFFVIIGAQIDISTLANLNGTLLLIIAMVVGSVSSKLLSGWVGAKMVGFDSNQSLLFSISSVAQLSTTLAVAFTALSLGVIDNNLITAMVALSIVTVVAAPILMNIFSERIKKAVPEIDMS